jgi:hypothetical protein
MNLRQVLDREGAELTRQQQALGQAHARLRQQLGIVSDRVVWQFDRSDQKANGARSATPERNDLDRRLAEIDDLQRAVVDRLRSVYEILLQEIARLQQALTRAEAKHAEAVDAAALVRTRADAQCRELRSQVAVLRQQLNRIQSLHGEIAPARPLTPQTPGQPLAGIFSHSPMPLGFSAAANGAFVGAVIGGGIALVGAVLRGPMANAMVVAVFGMVLLGLSGALIGAGCGIAHRTLRAKIADIWAAWRRRGKR